MSAHEKFTADLLAVNVHLPLSISTECEATLVDATGRDVATIDMNNTRPDPEACRIALWLMLAVNVCGGVTRPAQPTT